MTSYQAPTSALPKSGFAVERLGVDHHQVDDLAGDVGAVEELGRVGLLEDRGDKRVPGHHRLHVVGGEGRDHVRVRGVDDAAEIGLGQPDAVERARQQVMRHRQFDEVDGLAFEPGQIDVALSDHRVVAVGIIADDQRGGVHAAARGDRQRVHVGGRNAVEGAGGVLVDRFDVVVDLHDLDVDAVLLGPFVHDAGLSRDTPTASSRRRSTRRRGIRSFPARLPGPRNSGRARLHLLRHDELKTWIFPRLRRSA